MNKHIYSRHTAARISIKQQLYKTSNSRIQLCKAKRHTQVYNRIMQFTRQHLNNTTSQDWRHTHTVTQNPKRKGSRNFPERVVESSFARPLLRVPPAWSTGSCHALFVSCARQLGRGFGEMDGFSTATSARMGGNCRRSGSGEGNGRRSVPPAGLGTAPTPTQGYHLKNIQIVPIKTVGSSLTTNKQTNVWTNRQTNILAKIFASNKQIKSLPTKGKALSKIKKYVIFGRHFDAFPSKNRYDACCFLDMVFVKE